MKEVDWNEDIPKAEFVYAKEFMMMKHNYLCAVCKTESAVQDMDKGILQPCWECQKKGFILTNSWLFKFFSSKLFI